MLNWLIRSMALLACLAAAGAHAQYPDRPIKVVAPMAAGGGTDTVARAFAQKLAVRLGAPVIVENKPGGGGQIGPEFVAASTPDGYTMLFTSSSALTLPFLKKTRFDLMKDFVPVAEIGSGSFALVINPKLPYKTAQEFFDAARAQPNKFNYGSAGVGAIGHLALELLKQRSGVQLVHIPYKSSLEITRGLTSGELDVAIDPMTTQRPNAEQGMVRALATTGAERDPFLPNVPTLTETKTVPGGYELTYWFGVFLPAKTPVPIVDRLRKEFADIMKEPDMVQRLATFSLRPVYANADQFSRSIVEDSAMWQKLIKEQGIEIKD